RFARREPRLLQRRRWTCSARRGAIAVAGFVARESLRVVPSRCLVQAAQWWQSKAWQREPQVTAMAQSEPLPRAPQGQLGVKGSGFGFDPPVLRRVRGDRFPPPLRLW